MSHAAAIIVWEFDEYQFREGENATNEICAVVVNSTVTVEETRQVIFRNGSATGMVNALNILKYTRIICDQIDFIVSCLRTFKCSLCT